MQSLKGLDEAIWDVSFAVIVTGCLVATTCEVFVPPPPVRVSTTVIPEDIFNHTSPMLFKRNLHHFRWRHEYSLSNIGGSPVDLKIFRSLDPVFYERVSAKELLNLCRGQHDFYQLATFDFTRLPPYLEWKLREGFLNGRKDVQATSIHLSGFLPRNDSFMRYIFGAPRWPLPPSNPSHPLKQYPTFIFQQRGFSYVTVFPPYNGRIRREMSAIVQPGSLLYVPQFWSFTIDHRIPRTTCSMTIVAQYGLLEPAPSTPARPAREPPDTCEKGQTCAAESMSNNPYDRGDERGNGDAERATV